jgi:hypothetical protein
MKVEKGKPAGYVSTKRLIGNAVFARHQDITLSNCPFLVDDLETVKVKSDGSMDKLGDSTKSHLLDALLDGLYTIFKGNILNIR